MTDLLRRLRLRASRMLALLCFALPFTAQAAEDVSEYGMKAVLFYRLPQFVYWPQNETEPRPRILCVVGKNPFNGTLSQLKQQGETIDLRIAPADPTQCHFLFIGRSESNNLESWLGRADGRTTLTISDIPGFARSGGMVELTLEGERVGLVINRRSATRKGFDFNAQLLRLARVINP